MKNQEEANWTKLDNASRLFPSTFSGRDTKVFRLACELNEAVCPETLQEALNITVENFPIYKSVLRRGVFWYYLESSSIPPVVQLESTPVCALIYMGHKGNLLFRVSYFGSRINFEVFHVLSDGTGALKFLESLIYNYLSLMHKEELEETVPQFTEASISEQMDDSFDKYFEGVALFGRKNKEKDSHGRISAYRIRGTRLAESRLGLIEGVMSAKAVLEQAHYYNTTLTVFIASLLVYSIYKEMPARRTAHPVVLSVPINLRQFFRSATARNFFSTMDVSYNFREGASDLESVIKGLSKSFQKELTEEQVNRKLNRFVHLAQNPFIRVVPLNLKDFLLRVGSYFTSSKVTSGISNIGRIDMPPKFAHYIRQFTVCIGALSPRVTLCTYGDRMAISFSSPFRETEIQRNFFKFLSEKDIDIEISSNL